MFDFAYICEKPSLAETVASVVARMNGTTATKENGYWACGKDIVTWVRGHFFEQWMPGDYDVRYKGFRVEHFPFFPDKWKRKPRTDDYTKKQLPLVKACIAKAKNIVNVGDPGREGQLLIDEVLEEFGYDPFAKNMWRLWPDDLTNAALERCIKARFPNAEKKNLFDAAVMRQRADWVHGLNLTGMYTALAERGGARGMISVGRVQTPVLALVVARDREIENFKAVKHFLPNILFAHANGKFKADWIIPEGHPGTNANGQLVDKAAADAVLAKVAGKTGKVESYAVTKKSKTPPLVYSLATLQKKCASALGLTADQTLEVAQHLYDNKITSYPRTESEHLRTEMFQEAPVVIGSLASVAGLSELARNADTKIWTKVWDDRKSKEHYGLVPTKEFKAADIARLSPVQRAVFDLIAKNYLANFYPDQTWNSVAAVVGVEGERFKATGRKVTAQGWRVVFGAEDEEDDKDKETEQSVPQMTKGDPVKAENGSISLKETTPPPRFNDGTLVEAMTKIWNYVTEPEVKKRLNESGGLGTAATRAGIIKTLLSREFLARPKPKGGKASKNDAVVLISTKKGRSVVDVLPSTLTSPGLTALWEGQLGKIADGTFPPEQFYETLLKTVTKYCERAKETPLKIKGLTVDPLPGDGEACPSCGKGHMRTRVIQKGDHKGKRYLSCDAYVKDDPNSCRHAVFPEAGPKKEVKPAEGHGKTCPKCGKGQLITRKSKSGTVFLGCNNWTKDKPELSCSHVEFIEDKIQPLPGDGDQCPSCGKGRLRTRKIFSGEKKGERFLSCDAYKKDDPASCRHAVFPNSGGASKGGSSGGGRSKASGGKSTTGRSRK